MQMKLTHIPTDFSCTKTVAACALFVYEKFRDLSDRRAEATRQSCQAWLDLEDAITEFDWTSAIVTAARENRMKAVSYYGKRPAVVVFKTLGAEATSLISFRPAGAKERKLLK